MFQPLLPYCGTDPSLEHILSAFENGERFVNPNLITQRVHNFVEEFNNTLNGSLRSELLNYETTEKEELLDLLINLKKNIKSAITEIGKSLKKKEYSFICGLCYEILNVNPNKNFWSSLQDHGHVEQLYYSFIKNELHLSSAEEKDLEDSCCISYESAEEIQQNNQLINLCYKKNMFKKNTEEFSNKFKFYREVNAQQTSNGMIHFNGNDMIPHENANEDYDVNSFRFSFVLHHDEKIESKLYPTTLMIGVRKVDRIDDYTLQRSGPNRAACLICHCELINRTRISKYCLLSHAMGQKHLHNAGSPEELSALKMYHEIWFNQETPVQSHQVYFRPTHAAQIKCIICNSNITHSSVIAHILSEPHKKRVLDMYQKRNYTFFLLDEQVKLYGITMEQIDINETSNAEKNSNINRRQRNKSNNRLDRNVPVEHNIIISVENPHSTDPLELLPNRYKAHLQFIKRSYTDSGAVISCNICDTVLSADLRTIKNHILHRDHIKFSKINFKHFIYYCEICNMRFSDEGVWQKHFFVGQNKHDKISESCKARLMEYECTSCNTVIFGNDLSLTRHLSVGQKRGKNDGIILPEVWKKAFMSAEALELEGKKLAKEAEDVLRNKLTEECCEKLTSTLNEAFGNCTVHLFGSRVSGIGNKDSDLDVFVDIGDMYSGNKNQDLLSQVKIIKTAFKVFLKYRNQYQNIRQVPTARTPIVTVYHIPTNVKCDLSFRHGLSVENTKFVRFCFKLQPLAQPFVLLLKRWLKDNGLEITTYALVIMAIFFLQTKGYLLSVHRIRELNANSHNIIYGWETINYSIPVEDMRSHVVEYPSTVDHLLQEFFEYYSKFQYETDVVCPLLGRTILKNSFDQRSTIPNEMLSYIDQLDGNEPEIFKTTPPFCIQDPFDLSHNLLKACQEGTVNKFKKLCSLTLEYLNSLI